MAARARWQLGQDVHAVVRLELFIVAAISAILVTRGYLIVMDYPTIGSGGLHLAHVLWGGLLMLVSHVLLLGFLGPRVKELGALVGGVGFGLFIDEVGKFVTADNDYFFQPAFAIMYVVFVALVLLVHWLSERPRVHSATTLANAATIGAAGQLRGLDDIARSEAMHLTDAAEEQGADARSVAAVRNLIAASPAAEHGAGFYAAIRSRVLGILRNVVRSRAAVVIVGSLLVVLVVEAAAAAATVMRGETTTIRWVHLGWAVAIAAMIVAGIVVWRRRLLPGLRILRYVVLLNVMVGQVISFANHELYALPGLAASLTALGALNYRLRLYESPPERTIPSAGRPVPAADT